MMKLKVKSTLIFATWVILITTRVGYADLTDGLAAYYPFDGNANDMSGNDNHGVVYGAQLTQDRFDIANHAYFFDGQSNYIQVLDSPSLDIIGPISLATWVKADPDQYFRVGLISKRPPTEPSGGYDLRLNIPHVGSTESVAILDIVVSNTPLPTIAGGVSSNTFLDDNTWHHIVGTYDGTMARMYIDGILENTSGYSDGYVTNNEPLNIGRFLYGYNDGFGNKPNILNGVIDDVRIYNRALDQSEISELYNFNPVPAPGAFILGSLGLAFSGWKLRRRRAI